jgi:glycosyltransferase involved in cell wall biosynthesis
VKFSVVTATFNAERTLARCLESVKAQDGVQLEHIVIDGASKDGTLEILKASGVKFVSEPDRGVYDAFDKGLALADGQIVSFLGADDEYLPGALKAVEAEFERNPSLQCLHGNILVGAGEIRPAQGWDSIHGCRLLHPATFMRRGLLLELGGFDVEFKIAADLDLFLRASKSCELVHLDKALTRFSLGGLSTIRLFDAACELRAILLKNGFGRVETETRFIYQLCRSCASLAKRKLACERSSLS